MLYDYNSLYTFPGRLMSAQRTTKNKKTLLVNVLLLVHIRLRTPAYNFTTGLH